MPITNFSGKGNGLRVETRVGNDVVDNDELQATRSHQLHNQDSQPQSERMWATTYVDPTQPVAEDPSINAANTNELRNRNLLNINK